MGEGSPAGSDLTVFASFIVPVETNKQAEIFFKRFEAATKFEEEVAGYYSKTCGCGGCIPECFVGH
jgi:hypothetical protein